MRNKEQTHLEQYMPNYRQGRITTDSARHSFSSYSITTHNFEMLNNWQIYNASQWHSPVIKRRKALAWKNKNAFQVEGTIYPKVLTHQRIWDIYRISSSLMLVKKREGSLANGQITKHFICVRLEKSLPKQQELERSTACKQKVKIKSILERLPWGSVKMKC